MNCCESGLVFPPRFDPPRFDPEGDDRGPSGMEPDGDMEARRGKWGGGGE